MILILMIILLMNATSADDAFEIQTGNDVIVVNNNQENNEDGYRPDIVQCVSRQTTFHCDDITCIALDRKCNGIAECSNGADESVWECGCLDNEFFCNGTCIDLFKRCDVTVDCSDGTDEMDCETFACMASYFKCDNHFCIPGDHVCNFADDCGDNSDEHHCQPRDCWFREFRCDNGQCIQGALLCDGFNDCNDGSDEKQCDQNTNFVKCADGTSVHEAFWCDDWPDCKDNNADELNCRICRADEFRCSDSRCITLASVCDAICDCALNCEDEYNCHHNYMKINGIVQCLTGVSIFCQGSERCVGRKFICDGHDDCQHGRPAADEYGCHALINGSIESDSFRCSDGRAVPSILRCDYRNDCLYGDDEWNCTCNVDNYFRCTSGQCVDWSLRCDTVYDCKDRSDELHCELNVCGEGYFRCASGHCIQAVNECDFRDDCPDSSDELYCPNKLRNCSDGIEFRCRNGECVPMTTRCFHRPTLDRYGCADESHLLDCREWTCPSVDGDQFKCRNDYCIESALICNNQLDCKLTGTDEDDCLFQCSEQSKCACQDVTIDCTDAGLVELPLEIETQISRFVMSGNYLNETLAPEMFEQMERISFLDLSNNSLEIIKPYSFKHLHRLLILHLNDNRLNQITNGTFVGLASVSTLNLKRNNIAILEPFAFYGLSSLKSLDLSHQLIVNISRNAFVGLRSLHKLDLSNNRIIFLIDGSFNGLPQLLSLDLTKNAVQIMGRNIFHGLNSLQHLVTDEFRFCCLLSRQQEGTRCRPHPDEFSSCEDLMSNIVLRVSIWILGIVAFVGNILVIGWRAVRRTNNKVHSFLITNLAVGDMFMGAYLLVIAVVDARYRGVYFIYDSLWRQSTLCHVIGFLSTFSCELSVFTLTVITLDRFVSIRFPFRLKRLQMKHTRVVMAIIWVVVIGLAALPLAEPLQSYFGNNFYGRSGVCLALHITHEKPRGWEYSVAVFLALNFVSFMVIAASYLWMYAVARRTRAAVQRARSASTPNVRGMMQQTHSTSGGTTAAAVTSCNTIGVGAVVDSNVKRDNTMAKRMTLIVFTDFCCWMPIIVLGVASLAGVNIPPQVFAWIAVFVLPLNAAINPILYTLSTAPFLGPARKRVSTFRRSFMTSISGDTHRTIVSTFGDDQGRSYTVCHAATSSVVETDVQQPRGHPSGHQSAPLEINKIDNDCNEFIDLAATEDEIIPLQELNLTSSGQIESTLMTSSSPTVRKNRILFRDKVKFDKTNSLYN